MPGKLYLVATPIGNLQDITLRAIDTLRSVDLIACEDTRHTRKLLNHLRISNRTTSYHEHNENERAEEFVDRLAAGENIAIVTDAGMPGISDPGFRAVRRAAEAGFDVVVIPGAVAFVAAAAASGLPSDAIFFGGFLPSKKGERERRLKEVQSVPATLVFYEAPHRLAASLEACHKVLGNRPAAVARELTKIHEEFARGTLHELAAKYAEHKAKGEIVIVIERGSGTEALPEATMTLAERVAQLAFEGVEPKAALKQAAREFGMSKSRAYRELLSAK